MRHLATQSSTPIDAPVFEVGHYSVQLASEPQQIAQAQALRYRVFYLENGGKPPASMRQLEREIDEWDEAAHHIVVCDKKDNNRVVGTLRLMSNERLVGGQQFYTEQAFDLSNLRNRYQRILELSRYCIDSNGRSGTILMLIWKFAMKFIIDHKFELMLGCASFHGQNIANHWPILSYLYRHNLAPKALMPRPRVTHCADLAALTTDEHSWELAKHAVPTLLRGYLKLGAKISDHAIIDAQFNSVFVCIYVDAAQMLKDSHALVPR